MSAIINFLAMIDIFGIIFPFRYKDKEKYQTAFGGFLLILFIALALGMGIYYFIPFIKRKNYTIVYYTMNLAETEAVDLFASQSNFAIGLNCENNDDETRDIYDMLDSIGGIETAISNAKRRMADFDPNKDKPSKFAPGTKVYCLVEKLREYLIQDVEQ